MPSDIVIDTLDTLIDLLRANGGTLLPAHRLEAERIVRAAWGGDRVYVLKSGEHGQRRMSERDHAIRRDFRRGAAVELLCRRYALSDRRIREIVAPERDESQEEPDAGAAPACLIRRREPADTAENKPAPPARRARRAA